VNRIFGFAVVARRDKQRQAQQTARERHIVGRAHRTPSRSAAGQHRRRSEADRRQERERRASFHLWFPFAVETLEQE
jgi:hypothetical protein